MENKNQSLLKLLNCKYCGEKRNINPITLEPFEFCTGCGSSFINTSEICQCVKDVQYGNPANLHYYHDILWKLPHPPDYKFCGKCGLATCVKPVGWLFPTV